MAHSWLLFTHQQCMRLLASLGGDGVNEGRTWRLENSPWKDSLVPTCSSPSLCHLNHSGLGQWPRSHHWFLSFPQPARPQQILQLYLQSQPLHITSTRPFPSHLILWAWKLVQRMCSRSHTWSVTEPLFRHGLSRFKGNPLSPPWTESVM